MKTSENVVKWRRVPVAARTIGLLGLLGAFGLTLIACSRTASQQSGTAAPKPVQVQPADVKKLAWIEGSWRGTGEGVPPFFERYRLDGDALVMEGFEDGTLAKVTESTRYEVRDGVLSNGRSEAIELNDTSVKFLPKTSMNSFSWVKKSPDAWTAILDVPANGGKPARQVIYQLERWTPPTGAPAAPAKP